MVVFKIKIKSILKGIRKIKPLKLVVGGAKHIPGVGSIVAEGESLYNAARKGGKNVGQALEATGEGLLQDVRTQNDVQAATPWLMIGLVVVAFILVTRGGRK